MPLPNSIAATQAVVNAPKSDGLRAGDYDGDRKTEFGTYAPATGVWSILKSGANYTTSMTVPWGGDPTDVPVPGDYDGDGKTDVAVFRGSAGTWYVLKSSTGYTAGTTFTFGTAGDVPVPGDDDGEGITDLAVSPSTGQWLIRCRQRTP